MGCCEATSGLFPVCPPTSLVLLSPDREGRQYLERCGERAETQASFGPKMPTPACVGEASRPSMRSKDGNGLQVIRAFALAFNIHLFESS